jgi:beta-glucosidase
MAQAAFHFPRGFLWGTATAAHQVEGGNTLNNWAAWEQEPGRIRGDQQAGLACDWWNGRWREDFDRAAEAQQNAHRFSVEWSRIQPTPDRWDETALDRYREMARGASERGLTPMVTLHHFTDPLWLTERGGWENPAVVTQFATFARRVVEALKEYVALWVTINEPNVYTISGYVTGDFPPGRNDLKTAFTVMTNQVAAHAAAYRAIHAAQPTARVGLAYHFRPFIPAHNWSPLDYLVARLQNSQFNEFFPNAVAEGILRFPTRRVRMPEAKETQDFIGVNYYTRELIAFDPFRPKDVFAHRYYPREADLSGTGFLTNDPLGMFETLKWCNQFGLPMIVTENGVEDAEDRMRPRYLIEHLHQVWRGANFNWPIKGYFHWSLVDNFEWERGWSQRFGLWELEVDTQVRRKRPSADLYAEICRENGITAEMTARYAPEIFARLFPN